MQIPNLQNNNRKFVSQKGNFFILEYQHDASVSPDNAATNYYMSTMGVRRRQLVIELNDRQSVVIQAGAMQWMAGNIQATAGIKGVGDLFGKVVRGAMTKESAIKPEYVGNGVIALEPTYKHLVLVDVSEWGAGITIENGMFYACSGTVRQSIVARRNLSSAALGGEGLFDLNLSGQGIAALESNVPYEELLEIDLANDTLRIDGNLAVCWSSNLEFTVERTTKALIGSGVSGEGLVNVYRGTGKVLMCPVAPTGSLYEATHTTEAKAAAVTSNTMGH